VFGFNFEPGQEKTYGWADSLIPLFVVADAHRSQLMREMAAQMATATKIAAAALLGAVVDVQFPKRQSGQAGHRRGDQDKEQQKKRQALASVQDELWNRTEGSFYTSLQRVSETDTEEEAEVLTNALRAEFADILRDEALAVFDRCCPTPGLAPEPLRRRVLARHGLNSALTGYSKLGEQLFTALGVPLPGGGRSARAAAKRARMEAAS
jgi:hypothetical protein